MAGKPNKPIEYAKEHTGRPSKFTPEIRAAIVDDIAHHVPYILAAQANGIAEVTLYEWLKKGNAHLHEGIESDYSVFAKDIKRAETRKIREHTIKINDNVDRWQADAWLLERRWYKHYGSNAPLMDLNRELAELKQGLKNENNAKEASKESGDEERS